MTPKPWYINVATIGLAALWMGWTYATMQQQGSSLALIGGAVAIAITAMIIIHSPRVARVSMGRFQFDLENFRDGGRDDAEDEPTDEMPEEWEKFR